MFQLATVMDILIAVLTQKRLTSRLNLLTSTAVTRAEESVKTAVITRKASIVTSAKTDFSGPTESNGMRPMCANVSRFCLNLKENYRSILSTACHCDYFYSTGNCDEGTGHCQCRAEFQAPNCDSCAEGYFGYPNCRPCECNLNGTLGYHCEATDGQVAI